MCLSAIYLNNYNEKSFLMDNIQSITVQDDKVTLIDLFEKKTEIKGKIKEINLVENYAIIETKETI